MHAGICCWANAAQHCPSCALLLVETALITFWQFGCCRAMGDVPGAGKSCHLYSRGRRWPHAAHWPWVGWMCLLSPESSGGHMWTWSDIWCLKIVFCHISVSVWILFLIWFAVCLEWEGSSTEVGIRAGMMRMGFLISIKYVAVWWQQGGLDEIMISN